MGGLAATGMGALIPALPRARKAKRPQAPDKTWSGDRDELLNDLVRKFEAHEMTCAPARVLAQRDRDYYDNKQWSATELLDLADRGQPPTIDNFIKEKVDYQAGAERRLRSDPKAYPRTPAQDDHADAATQLIRWITDDNVFNRVRSDVWQNIVIEGVGGAEVVAEEGADGQMDVRIHHIPYDRLWWDSYSAHPDFHDARHMGTVMWGDRSQFLELFPGKELVLETTLGPSETWGWGDFADRPPVPWVDTKRTRVRIVTCHWQHDGDWWTAIYTRGGFLHGPVVSPYLDRRGQTCCPLILRSAKVDRENNRYGLVRDLIPLQDEINKRRSKMLHLLNTQRIVAEHGAVTDEDEARRQVARPDGMVLVNKGFRFEIDQNAELSSGQFQLLAHTIGRLQGHGPNASMTGKDPRELSGRAISLQQAGGAVEQEPDLDGLRLWSRRIYEHVWMRARQFVDDTRVVRVMDTPDKARYVPINQPVTFGEALAQLPPDQQAYQMQRYRIAPGDPRLQHVVGYRNDIGDLDMEITVEEGADVPTLAFEQFNQLVQLAQSLPPGTIPPKLIIQASSLRNKQELLDMLNQHEAQQGQQQGQQAQIGQAMAMAKVKTEQAKAADIQAATQDKQAQAAERVHRIARDHAEASATPVWNGIGPVDPEASPLLPQNQPPPPPAPMQGAAPPA